VLSLIDQSIDRSKSQHHAVTWHQQPAQAHLRDHRARQRSLRAGLAPLPTQPWLTTSWGQASSCVPTCILRMEAHACERQTCGQTVKCTGKMESSAAQQHETSAPVGTRGYTELEYPAGVPPAEHGRRWPVDGNPVVLRLTAIEPEIGCRRLAAR
jgi:hypothetical protein